MTLDLSKYMIQGEPEGDVQESQSTVKPLDLDLYISPESETGYQSFKRHAARTGSRVAETIAGFPGDFVKFVDYLGSKLPEVKMPLQEKNPLIKAGKKALHKLPTSQDLQEFSQELTKGYTEPKTEVESLADDIASLSTALLLPSKNPAKVKNLLSAVGKATAAKGAAKGAEALGGGEKTQLAAEMGTLFLTGLFGAKTADKYIGEKFREARSRIPEGDILGTQKLLSGLESVEKELSKGISTATKNEILGPLKELKNKAAGGGMLVDDLVESFHNLNEKMGSKKLFDELSKSEHKLLKHRYDLLKNEVRGTLADYGQRNPEFFKVWQDANQGYATIAQSKKVSDFITRNKNKVAPHLGTTLAIELLFGKPELAAATGAAAAGSYGAIKTGELMYRIINSPTLRKHYLEVIENAGKENLPATIKSLNSLGKGLEAG